MLGRRSSVPAYAHNGKLDDIGAGGNNLQRPGVKFHRKPLFDLGFPRNLAEQSDIIGFAPVSVSLRKPFSRGHSLRSDAVSPYIPHASQNLIRDQSIAMIMLNKQEALAKVAPPPPMRKAPPVPLVARHGLKIDTQQVDEIYGLGDVSIEPSDADAASPVTLSSNEEWYSARNSNESVANEDTNQESASIMHSGITRPKISKSIRQRLFPRLHLRPFAHQAREDISHKSRPSHTANVTFNPGIQSLNERDPRTTDASPASSNIMSDSDQQELEALQDLYGLTGWQRLLADNHPPSNASSIPAENEAATYGAQATNTAGPVRETRGDSAVSFGITGFPKPREERQGGENGSTSQAWQNKDESVADLLGGSMLSSVSSERDLHSKHIDGIDNDFAYLGRSIDRGFPHRDASTGDSSGRGHQMQEELLHRATSGGLVQDPSIRNNNPALDKREERKICGLRPYIYDDNSYRHRRLFRESLSKNNYNVQQSPPFKRATEPFVMEPSGASRLEAVVDKGKLHVKQVWDTAEGGANRGEGSVAMAYEKRRRTKPCSKQAIPAQEHSKSKPEQSESAASKETNPEILEFQFDYALTLESQTEECEDPLRVGTRSCAVCSDDKLNLDFPSIAVTSKCTHESSTCTECLQTWIKSELGTKGTVGIKCPECPSTLKYDDIRRAASRETFATYDLLIFRQAMAKDPDFFYCLSPHCGSGQIHVGNNKHMICDACNFEQCVQHGIKWHNGETCKAWDARHASAQNAQRATDAMLDSVSRLCPNSECGWRIQKSDGCDHMRCRQCGFEFCFSCGASQDRIRAVGNEAHEPNCRFYARSGRAGWPFNVH